MKTTDIRYCVEYTYNGPSSDFFPIKSKRFFTKQNNVSKFLIDIKEKKGDNIYCYNPIVYMSIFERWGNATVDSMVESYEKSLIIEEINLKKKKQRALSKLSEEDRKILCL